MRLSEIQNKDVISVNDGKKIGNIIDININMDGTLNSLIVEKSKFIISKFTSNGEIEVKWSEIKKIGDDVILVNLGSEK